jgi:hypothetical protein
MSNLYYDDGEGVMIATTAYDSPDASYTYSISRSREYLHSKGIETAYLLLQGNCHVDDARNTVVRDFLKSSCEELVFIDADVSWEPEDLYTLCRFDCDLVGGVYPYRRDGGGKDAMPVRNMSGQYRADNGLLEVEGLPTGFMRIRRHVLESMAKQSKTFTKDGAGDIPLIFERDVYKGGRRGGDIGFCMKWREMGGRVYAAADLRLGHCGKQVLKDSLSACLRRQMGESLKYVCDRIKAGEDARDDYHEAVRAVQNPWGAQIDVLALAVGLARNASKPILEAGSGLSTVLMAAATDQTVYCLEHHAFYAAQTEFLARQAGVSNICIVQNPIKDEWYDIESDLPDLPSSFSLGVVDGPPRIFGDRMGFFPVFGEKCDTILIDDADDRGYREKLSDWAASQGRGFEPGDDRAAVILPKSLSEAA